MEVHPEHRKVWTERLVHVQDLAALSERRAEAFELISTSASPQEATARLADLLDIPEERAESLVIQRLTRFTQAEADKIVDEREELLRLLRESD